MSLYDCEAYAKQHGFDSVRFTALFPSGPRVCQWLDAHMGILKIDGVGDGFVMTKQIADMYPDTICIPWADENAAEPQQENGTK